MADKKKRKRVKYNKVIKSTPILEFSTKNPIIAPNLTPKLKK